jgi:hypothetical protein
LSWLPILVYVCVSETTARTCVCVSQLTQPMRLALLVLLVPVLVPVPVLGVVLA